MTEKEGPQLTPKETGDPVSKDQFVREREWSVLNFTYFNGWGERITTREDESGVINSPKEVWKAIKEWTTEPHYDGEECVESFFTETQASKTFRIDNTEVTFVSKRPIKTSPQYFLDAELITIEEASEVLKNQEEKLKNSPYESQRNFVQVNRSRLEGIFDSGCKRLIYTRLGSFVAWTEYTRLFSTELGQEIPWPKVEGHGRKDDRKK